MKWKCNDLKCVQKQTQSQLSLTHHANKSSRWADKYIKWSESPWNQSGRKGKGLSWRKWFAEEPSLKFRVKDWTSKRRCKWWSWRWWRRWWWTATCVIGESEGDCVWRGSRRSVGSSFHRQGAAYWKDFAVDKVHGKSSRFGLVAIVSSTKTEVQCIENDCRWTVSSKIENCSKQKTSSTWEVPYLRISFVLMMFREKSD